MNTFFFFCICLWVWKTVFLYVMENIIQWVVKIYVEPQRYCQWGIGIWNFLDWSLSNLLLWHKANSGLNLIECLVEIQRNFYYTRISIRALPRIRRISKNSLYIKLVFIWSDNYLFRDQMCYTLFFKIKM